MGDKLLTPAMNALLDSMPVVYGLADDIGTYWSSGNPTITLGMWTAASGFGFATKDEGNSVLKVVANLQTRVNELETKLKALNLLS